MLIGWVWVEATRSGLVKQESTYKYIEEFAMRVALGRSLILGHHRELRIFNMQLL